MDALGAGGEKAEEPRPLHRQAAPPTGAAHEQGMVVQTTHWGQRYYLVWVTGANRDDCRLVAVNQNILVNSALNGNTLSNTLPVITDSALVSG